jgi:hypothetical protein
VSGVLRLDDLTDRGNLPYWLPFLDTYRTLCVAPPPDFRRLLEEIWEVRLVA